MGGVGGCVRRGLVLLLRPLVALRGAGVHAVLGANRELRVVAQLLAQGGHGPHEVRRHGLRALHVGGAVRHGVEHPAADHGGAAAVALRRFGGHSASAGAESGSRRAQQDGRVPTPGRAPPADLVRLQHDLEAGAPLALALRGLLRSRAGHGAGQERARRALRRAAAGAPCRSSGRRPLWSGPWREGTSRRAERPGPGRRGEAGGQGRRSRAQADPPPPS